MRSPLHLNAAYLKCSQKFIRITIVKGIWLLFVFRIFPSETLLVSALVDELSFSYRSSLTWPVENNKTGRFSSKCLASVWGIHTYCETWLWLLNYFIYTKSVISDAFVLTLCQCSNCKEYNKCCTGENHSFLDELAWYTFRLAMTRTFLWCTELT